MDEQLMKAKNAADFMCESLHAAHKESTAVGSFVLMRFINDAESLRMRIAEYGSALDYDKKTDAPSLR